MTTSRLILAHLAVLGVLILASACNASITFGEGIDGSGELVTETFEVGDFDSIEVQDAFDAVITVGESRSVEVVVDDNLLDDLDIRVRNGELRVGLENGVSLRNGTLEATITLPDLVALEVTGASSTSVTGVFSPSQDYTVSGASSLVVEGTATTIDVDTSGASTVDLRLDGLQDARVDLSGATKLELLHADTVSGSMSGASDLTIPAATNVTASTSGASTIHRR